MMRRPGGFQDDLDFWHDEADRAAGSRVAEGLAPRIALPSSFGRAFVVQVAEEAEQEAQHWPSRCVTGKPRAVSPYATPSVAE